MIIRPLILFSVRLLLDLSNCVKEIKTDVCLPLLASLVNVQWKNEHFCMGVLCISSTVSLTCQCAWTKWTHLYDCTVYVSYSKLFCMTVLYMSPTLSLTCQCAKKKVTLLYDFSLYDSYSKLDLSMLEVEINTYVWLYFECILL